jgi:sugar phosphate isomerase/epimerase
MINKENSRRSFIKQSGLVVGGLALSPSFACGLSTKEAFDFKISLAEWSIREALKSGETTNLNFPKYAKTKYGIYGVEYVSFFFGDSGQDKTYLKELNKVADGEGVNNLLIMVGREGNLGDSNQDKRLKAIDNHKRWVETAKAIGCHSIRVDARGGTNWQEMHNNTVESFTDLSNFAKDFGLNIILENHGGLSSNAKWVTEVMHAVNLPNCGTLPDFGNFCIEKDKARGCFNKYDRYKGTKEMMPFAKAVSAKSYDFDKNGNETTIDYKKMLNIIKDAGYSEYIGIEYEGTRLSPDDGIMATKNLLEKIREDMS